MAEMESRVKSEYMDDLKEEIRKYGLKASVRERMIRINKIVQARRRYLGTMDTYKILNDENEIIDLIDAAREVIVADLPIKPAPGRWIEERGGCECPSCHGIQDAPTNFCPECGAAMAQ